MLGITDLDHQPFLHTEASALEASALDYHSIDQFHLDDEYDRPLDLFLDKLDLTHHLVRHYPAHLPLIV